MISKPAKLVVNEGDCRLWSDWG